MEMSSIIICNSRGNIVLAGVLLNTKQTYKPWALNVEPAFSSYIQKRYCLCPFLGLNQ